MNKFQKEKGGKRLIDPRRNFNPNVLFALDVSSLLKRRFTNPNQKNKKKKQTNKQTKEEDLPYSSFLNLTKGNLISKKKIEN